FVPERTPVPVTWPAAPTVQEATTELPPDTVPATSIEVTCANAGVAWAASHRVADSTRYRVMIVTPRERCGADRCAFRRKPDNHRVPIFCSEGRMRGKVKCDRRRDFLTEC